MTNKKNNESVKPAISVAHYRDWDGVGCPVCLATDIEGEGVDIEGGLALQQVSCLVCHAVWTDEYQRTVYTLHADA